MVEQGLAASGDFRVVRCGWGGHLGFYSTVPRFSEVANCGDLLNVRARFDIGAGTVRVDTETAISSQRIVRNWLISVLKMEDFS